MSRKIDYHKGQVINGMVFTREVEPYTKPSGDKERKAVFKCFCGNEFEAMISHVKRGHTNSCGCYNKQRIRETNTKHGLSQHPLYRIWAHMKNRCYNPKGKHFKNWGGRGITICKEWEDNPKTFISWAVSHGWKKGLQIDRVNNNGNYEPNNCRFVTSAENNRNKRTTKLTAERVIEIRNAKLLMPELTLKELGEAYNVDFSTIGDILRNKTWRDVS